MITNEVQYRATKAHLERADDDELERWLGMDVVDDPDDAGDVGSDRLAGASVAENGPGADSLADGSA